MYLHDELAELLYFIHTDAVKWPSQFSVGVLYIGGVGFEFSLLQNLLFRAKYILIWFAEAINFFHVTFTRALV